MKRVLCAIFALVMCFAMAAPAFATENEFVPSITYKDAPEIVEAKLGDEDVAPCLVVTSILAAQNKTTDVHQDNRDLLLDVYEKLSNGTMTLPLKGDYVIVQLVDVDFAEGECVADDHSHEEELNKDNTTISITFKAQIDSDTDIVVMQYKGGEWRAVESKSNDDGTITCKFEDFCPVAFVANAEGVVVPKTGDDFGQNMGLWIGLMLVSVAGLAVVVANRRKIAG